MLSDVPQRKQHLYLVYRQVSLYTAPLIFVDLLSPLVSLLSQYFPQVFLQSQSIPKSVSLVEIDLL